MTKPENIAPKIKPVKRVIEKIKCNSKVVARATLNTPTPKKLIEERIRKNKLILATLFIVENDTFFEIILFGFKVLFV